MSKKKILLIIAVSLVAIGISLLVYGQLSKTAEAPIENPPVGNFRQPTEPPHTNGPTGNPPGSY